MHLTITEARVKELRDLADEALLHNLVSKKWLKSFAGKTSSFASILIFWRPFLRSIWAAIFAVPSDGIPQNCVWVKQFVVAVKWIRAFLNGVQGNIVRTFVLDMYVGAGPFARMVFDASPWEPEASWLWTEILCLSLPRNFMMKRQSGSSLVIRLRNRSPRLWLC